MTMSKLTDFYTHKAALINQGQTIEPQREQLRTSGTDVCLVPDVLLYPFLWNLNQNKNRSVVRPRLLPPKSEDRRGET